MHPQSRLHEQRLKVGDFLTSPDHLFTIHLGRTAMCFKTLDK
jgi:hypothetical protein